MDAKEIILKHSDTTLRHIYDPADYNPQDAHAYYEAHKKLKGRQPGQGKPVPVGRHKLTKQLVGKHGGKKVPTKSPEQRRKEIAARVSSLSHKLARLKAIYEELLKQAKERSGVKDTTAASKDTKTSTKADGTSSKLSPTERKKAAQAAQDWRDKHKDTPEEQAAALEKQIAEVQAKIADIKAQIARARSATSNAKDISAQRTSSSVGARATPNK